MANLHFWNSSFLILKVPTKPPVWFYGFWFHGFLPSHSLWNIPASLAEILALIVEVVFRPFSRRWRSDSPQKEVPTLIATRWWNYLVYISPCATLSDLCWKLKSQPNKPPACLSEYQSSIYGCAVYTHGATTCFSKSDHIIKRSPMTGSFPVVPTYYDNLIYLALPKKHTISCLDQLDPLNLWS